MKKALILIVVIAALIGLYYASQRSAEVKAPEEKAQTENGFRPDPSNGTFIFNSDSVTLSDGGHTRDLTANGTFQEETTLTDIVAYGDINADSKTDAAVILTRSGGVSGFFVYIAGYVSTAGSYRGTNAIFLGDRITPQSVSIDNGVVTLHYLDRREDEPLAAEPTVPTTKEFVFRSGELVER